MVRVFGLAVRISQIFPTETPPFAIDHPDLLVVRNGVEWALLWIIHVNSMDFGISANWALQQGTALIINWLHPRGYQGGEPWVAMFEIEEGEEIDLAVFVERRDWTTGMKSPVPEIAQDHST